MKTREDILNGNLWRLMWSMSLPGILGMIVVSLNGLVDAFFVAHLVGSRAFAGVSLAMPILMVNSAVTGMLSAGASVLYSRAIGAGENHNTKGLFLNLLALVVLLSLLLAVVGSIAGPYLLGFFGADRQVEGYGVQFYKLAILGSITSVLGLSTSALIRAEGNVAYAMKVTAAAVLLNAVVNPILIRFCNLGVQGSALATIISMGIYSLINLRYLIIRKSLWLAGKSVLIAFDINVVKTILITGLPSFFMQINGFLRQFVLFKLVSYYSSDTAHLAMFSGVYRLFSFCAVPVFGMLQAFSPIIGINFGAGRYDRVAKATQIFRVGTVALMLLMAVPGWLFPQTVLSTLIPKNLQLPEVIPYFRMVLFVLPMMPIASTSVVLLQSTGHSKIASRLTSGREILIFIPVILLATYWLGYIGVYYGLLIENVIYISLVYLVTRNMWQPQQPQ